MRSDHLKYFISLSAVIFLTWSISCSGRPGKPLETEAKSIPVPVEEAASKLVKIVSPDENTGFKLNDPIKVILAPADKDKLPDSVLVYFDGKAVKNVKSDLWECTIPQVFTKTTGRKSLKVTAFKGGKAQNSVTRFMIIYSDVTPKMYSYKVVHAYPHDKDAFTQGLVYDNGVLFEGTGQETGSSLREVELETGKVIRQHNLERSLFGEGITLYGNRIFQVTWENKVGFVYEKSTFKLINKIYYATQGWGLTTINDRIVMSDGTNVLYYFDPELFTVASRIEVYDNKKKIDSLNELEYINGEIWANIWMSDLIARIDPVTGKVIAYIDLKGILPAKDKNADTDVLNGIAFDQAGNRIFVTGKRWPKLFEISITE